MKKSMPTLLKLSSRSCHTWRGARSSNSRMGALTARLQALDDKLALRMLHLRLRHVVTGSKRFRETTYAPSLCSVGRCAAHAGGRLRQASFGKKPPASGWGDNRLLDAALHRLASTRIRHDPDRTCFQRRTATGSAETEELRALNGCLIPTRLVEPRPTRRQFSALRSARLCPVVRRLA